ncbi:hypothetical protein FRX31_007311 [Thalictrum thalictroides]|uniref:Uncharacterized protein n=1 Tax=Thalictrum thalictroides TaxID=46969 RepID=A0A7J6X042_THATH|nr:hypothetical protein FRX31_007311 [Thalictrum thalictroides]
MVIPAYGEHESFVEELKFLKPDSRHKGQTDEIILMSLISAVSLAGLVEERQYVFFFMTHYSVPCTRNTESMFD